MVVHSQRGFVWFYIFLSIALFALLSFAVMRMLRGGDDMGQVERARLSVQTVLDYAQRAKIVVQDMKINGITASSLSFLKDGDAGYATAPHTYKVFHPSGGGLALPHLQGVIVPDVFSPVTGAYMTRMAIDDVGTSADEVILSIRGLTQANCAQVNQELVGNDTIPATGADNHDDLFVAGTTDLTAAVCAACEGVQALCVSQSSPTIYTFYSVLDPN